ncbi:MAG: preprotein translocase subunit SecE [Clostridiales bacterium]|nr:preprotein translocase subunit SecE [Candidatus Equinaster intestinalis]
MDGVPSFVSVSHTSFVLITTILLLLALIFSIAHLLINDYIECAGKKPTIPTKVVRFLKDYKSESKKIVWPSLKDVVKNTIIVLIMCAILGVVIWALDYGLSALLNLLWK